MSKRQKTARVRTIILLIGFLISVFFSSLFAVAETANNHLESLITYAETLKNTNEYTAAVPSVQDTFDSSLKKAKDILAQPSPKDSEISSVFEKLLEAIWDLGQQSVDKSGLVKAIAAAKSIKQEDYTETSVARMLQSLEYAQKLLENHELTIVDQEHITNAVADLLKMIESLEYRNKPFEPEPSGPAVSTPSEPANPSEETGENSKLPPSTGDRADAGITMVLLLVMSLGGAVVVLNRRRVSDRRKDNANK